jgi:hypothetical protein
MWLLCLSLGLETAERRTFTLSAFALSAKPALLAAQTPREPIEGWRHCGHNGPAPPQGRTFVTSEQTVQDGRAAS